MENFKFYFHKVKDFVYTAKLNEFDGKTIYMVMWKENDEIDSAIYMKNDVEELIEKGIWIVI